VIKARGKKRWVVASLVLGSPSRLRHKVDVGWESVMGFK